MTRRKKEQPKQWHEMLKQGDRLLCVYTDQFVGWDIGDVVIFVAKDGGGLRLEHPNGEQFIQDERHFRLYESETHRLEIVKQWGDAAS